LEKISRFIRFCFQSQGIREILKEKEISGSFLPFLIIADNKEKRYFVKIWLQKKHCPKKGLIFV